LGGWFGVGYALAFKWDLKQVEYIGRLYRTMGLDLSFPSGAAVVKPIVASRITGDHRATDIFAQNCLCSHQTQLISPPAAPGTGSRSARCRPRARSASTSVLSLPPAQARACARSRRHLRVCISYRMAPHCKNEAEAQSNIPRKVSLTSSRTRFISWSKPFRIPTTIFHQPSVLSPFPPSRITYPRDHH
jgi:hypothetical protein